MPCKQCGTNDLEGFEKKELKAELAWRKMFAKEAKRVYMSKAWPLSARADWIFILDFILAFLGTSVSIGWIAAHLNPEFLSNPWFTPLLLLMYAGIFLVFFLPGIYLTIKERQMDAAFRKECPEHADAL